MRTLFTPKLLLSLGSLLVFPGCLSPRYPDELDADSPRSPVVDGSTASVSAVAAAAADVGPSPDAAATMVLRPDASWTFDASHVESAAALDASVMIGVAPEAGADAEPNARVSSCTITASTDASDTLFYAGEYGCVIWVAASSGKIVKVLTFSGQVAKRTKLPVYRGASMGMSIDVMASPTLRAPMQHRYAWDLKDMSGALVPAGEYTLSVETYSTNGDARAKIVFDPSKGPISESTSLSAGVRALKLECQ